MLLQQGDFHFSRVTKKKEQFAVNHTETQLLNVSKRTTNTRNEHLNFYEGGHTTVKNSIVNRKSRNDNTVHAD